MNVVLVEWFDACSIDGWSDIGEAAKLEPAQIQTCGFLVKDDDISVVICLSKDISNDSVSQFISIPKSWILNLTIVKEFE